MLKNCNFLENYLRYFTVKTNATDSKLQFSGREFYKSPRLIFKEAILFQTIYSQQAISQP